MTVNGVFFSKGPHYTKFTPPAVFSTDNQSLHPDNKLYRNEKSSSISSLPCARSCRRNLPFVRTTKIQPAPASQSAWQSSCVCPFPTCWRWDNVLILAVRYTYLHEAVKRGLNELFFWRCIRFYLHILLNMGATWDIWLECKYVDVGMTLCCMCIESCTTYLKTVKIVLCEILFFKFYRNLCEFTSGKKSKRKAHRSDWQSDVWNPCDPPHPPTSGAASHSGTIICCEIKRALSGVVITLQTIRTGGGSGSYLWFF